MKQSFFTIVSNEALTDVVYKMVLEGDTSAITNCGQFVDLRLPEKYLRRPISACDYDETALTLIYKVVGSGTEIMAALPVGTKLDVLTGLGNGYDTDLSGDRPVLVGGGVGVPPMFNLCKKLIAEGKLRLSGRAVIQPAGEGIFVPARAVNGGRGGCLIARGAVLLRGRFRLGVQVDDVLLVGRLQILIGKPHLIHYISNRLYAEFFSASKAVSYRFLVWRITLRYKDDRRILLTFGTNQF